jgi:hypothetical protein
MPRLGEAVEPTTVDRVAPWWRAVDARAARVGKAEPQVQTLPEAMPWPID